MLQLCCLMDNNNYGQYPQLSHKILLWFTGRQKIVCQIPNYLFKNQFCIVRLAFVAFLIQPLIRGQNQIYLLLYLFQYSNVFSDYHCKWYTVYVLYNTYTVLVDMKCLSFIQGSTSKALINQYKRLILLFPIITPNLGAKDT